MKHGAWQYSHGITSHLHRLAKSHDRTGKAEQMFACTVCFSPLDLRVYLQKTTLSLSAYTDTQGFFVGREGSEFVIFFVSKSATEAWAFLIKLKSSVLKPHTKFCSMHMHPIPVKSMMAIGTRHKTINKILKPFMGIHCGPYLTSTSCKTFLIALKL